MEFNHKANFDFFDDCYRCNIGNIEITEKGSVIKNISGDHLEGKGNKNVTVIEFAYCFSYYLPRGLDKIFPNVQNLSIYGCQLKEISNADLKGFPKLQWLSCSHTELEYLPVDLFEGMSKLRRISFQNNKLKYVDSVMFDPILDNDLEKVDFRYNEAISKYFTKENGDDDYGRLPSMIELLKAIDKECLKPFDSNKKLPLTTAIADLWTSKRFSDFTIVLSDQTKIPVHKLVLASQSSVFTAAFEQDFLEKQTGEYLIKDVSPDAVETFLKFFYTGEVSDSTHAMDLFALADEFDVENLKFIARRMIVENIDESNALSVLKLLDRYNSTFMKEVAFKFIQKSMFPNQELNESLINRPMDLEKVIGALHTRNRKRMEGKLLVENAEIEYEAILQSLNAKRHKST